MKWYMLFPISTRRNSMFRFWMCASLAVLSAVAGPLTLVPSGLGVGSVYHLVFVTSQTADGLNPNHAAYDSFVNSVAASSGNPNLAAITWNALVSTPNMAANGIVIGGPVYRLDGAPVATSHFDLWDGTLLQPINVNELGDGVANGPVWSGTNPNGTPAGITAAVLGGTSGTPITGSIGAATPNWIFSAPASGSTMLPLYAISQTLTVGGSQSTPVLAAAGGIAVLPNGQRVYTFTNTPGGFWYDPPGTSGFEYTGIAGTLFSSIELPTGFSNFTITYGPAFGTTLGSFGAGPVNFVSLAGGALGAFRITGINPTVNSDDLNAFPLLVHFAGGGNGSFSMTGLSDVPEPGTWALVLVGLGVAARRRHSNSR
jgi:PEP-CTERM motif